MTDKQNDGLVELLRSREDQIVDAWVRQQQQDLSLRNHLLRAGELEQQAREFFHLFVAALQSGGADTDVNRSDDWAAVRDLLTTVSRSRARQGFTPVETTTFVFSLKQPLFETMRASGDTSPERLWGVTRVIDQLGLFTTDTYQRGREEIISRQQQELLELSTPVVQLWEGVLALPLIGTLDSARTQVVMESLLQAIVDTGSSIAIIDITGVPVVDTLVAQHLLKTVAAARLMGADCIISGIRPQIAQTIVHLGVEINDVITKATLADAFAVALRRVGLTISRRTARKAEAAE
ncbi:MAG TPA: STAS domain-containing protein [Thermoanaerobaculia bacterium]|jgi:rsbT co-antagonist protein RsbR